MKKICFVVSSPMTVKSFLKEPINRLSKFYDVFLIVNLNNSDSSLLRDLPLKKIINFKIERMTMMVQSSSWLVSTANLEPRNTRESSHPDSQLIVMTSS